MVLRENYILPQWCEEKGYILPQCLETNLRLDGEDIVLCYL